MVVSYILGFLCTLLAFCQRGMTSVKSNSMSGGTAQESNYNRTYPLTPAERIGQSLRYRIGMVSDLDEHSKSRDGKYWFSYYKRGYLLTTMAADEFSIKWDREALVLKSDKATKDRGMELSELVVFDGKLLTVDDRTGIVYEIKNEAVIPWVTLMDGDGNSTKPLKAEWATVKDETLYVGGLGKEWTTTTGEFVNNNPFWVKTVSKTGQITHLNWTTNYMTLRRSLKIEFPGYMIHESGVWSSVRQRWFFLPRRLSYSQYNDVEDEKMGTNVLLSTDPNFQKVEVTYIGENIPTHGFSSFKFLPDSEDRVIVALKSEEVQDVSATYIIVFTIDGTILLPETKIADCKYEGLEFI